MSLIKRLVDKFRDTQVSPQERIAAEQVKDPSKKQLCSRMIWRGVPKRMRPGHRGYLGCSHWPQIISHATAERWKSEGRKPKNRITVTR